MASWFRLRLPGASEEICGATEQEGCGLAGNSFILAPFLFPADPLRNIPIGAAPRALDVPADLPEVDEPGAAEYERIIAAAVKALYGPEEKVVVSRTLTLPSPSEPEEIVARIFSAYPQAFRFAFSTPTADAWAGASPELLLQADGAELSTMALAGTRPAGTPGPWDTKNLREQRIVRDYILDIFTRHGLAPQPSADFTRQAGPVEHICTRISAPIPRDFSEEALLSLLADLSPTPALQGFPKAKALRLIRELESAPRGMYGGFCGPFTDLRHFTFFVNLRSMEMARRRVRLHIGGGITTASRPASEWLETESKSRTLLSLLH